jgi:hypothetical protein
MPKFEVAVYNKAVRDKVKQGERHRHLKDDWADMHYVEISAENLEKAQERARARFPEEDGYVIDSVHPA